nr:MAG TPA: hypothetical protein [Caudoviricetes sp.]
MLTSAQEGRIIHHIGRQRCRHHRGCTMLIKKENSFFTGIVNAIMLVVPMWAVIALIVYIIATRFEIIAKFSLTVG